ncbi:MAG TPA: hypothetical protein VGG56_11225 [Terracidiphilus sp.]
MKGVGNSAAKIAASLAAGALLAWMVNVDWVLEIIAGLVLLACALLGVFVGRWVYKALSDANPRWVRMSVAIILGVSVSFAALELTHSHKLIRDYEHYSSDYDE